MRFGNFRSLDGDLAEMSQSMIATRGESRIHSVLVRMETLDGGLIGEAAAGVARPDTSEPMRASHPVHIASVAKTFTAAMILQLAEEEKLGPMGIDSPFSDFDVLPMPIVERLHRWSVVSFGKRVTLRHLLTHTSGIRDAMIDDASQCGGPAPGSLISSLFLPGGNPAQNWVPWDRTRPDDKAAGVINFFIGSGIADSPLALPGERFHYSDTGFVLLGMLLERLSGRPLHDLMRHRILEPLGMKSTYLAYREDPPLGPLRQPEAEVYAGEIPLLTSGISLSFDWAGGGLVSTVGDLAAFMRGLVSGGLFMKPGTFGQMTEWIKPEGLDATRTGVGLGLFRTDCGGVELWGHSGAWGTKMIFAPESGLLFAGTTNQAQTRHDWHYPFIEKALDHLATTGETRQPQNIS